MSKQNSLCTDTIDAMLQQEDTGYIFGDYLHRYQEANGPLDSGNSGNSVDAFAREKMVDWCYTVANICKFDSETVEIAVSFLDRFLLTRKAFEIGALRDPRIFQLAVMAILYSAIKIHEPKAIDPLLLSSLSQGMYTAQQVECLELEILQALKWRLTPPTAHVFVRQYLEFLGPFKVFDDTQKEAIRELSMMQIRLAVRDYKFIMVNRSVLAFASILNAIESLGHSWNYARIGDELSYFLNIDWRSQEFIDVQYCLYAAVTSRAGPDVTGSMYIDSNLSQSKKKLHDYNPSIEASPCSTAE